jgi:murein DD-endopeptidase MepM/ murein hydrolase activator NlpD
MIRRHRKLALTLISLSLALPVEQAATAAPTVTATASGSGNYVFPVAGCKVSYVHSHHNYPATDIMAKIGCNFVAPTDGVVDEVNRVDRFKWKTDLGADRGGLSISIVGSDGVRYYGSHLSKIAAGIAPGVSVNAGDLLGLVGDSGDAKGLASHLHFGISWPTPKGIWWVRRGELYPWPYLDAWRAGKMANPANSVAKLEAKIGLVPKIPAY